MEKFLENLIDARKMIQTADHMVYVTYPLINDKKILLKILQELKTAMAKCISSLLQFDYLYKRIKLHTDTKANLQTFKEKCAPRAKITLEEVKSAYELFEIVEKQKRSSMDFIRKEKLVILSENLEPQVVTLEKIKEFLVTTKEISKKVHETINSQI